jgi:hypothetical protein
MMALLPVGDESAMNFERAGVFFGIIFISCTILASWE